MNQILITGEEKLKVKKEKKVLPINSIVLFFAISVIILGICMISGSVYAKDKINEIVEINAKPQVEINRDDENNTIEVKVNHIRGITKITYRWNDEEETVIDGNNEKVIEKTIPLIGGQNVLRVTVTEENGQSVSYEKTYNVTNMPKVEFEAVSNGVQITVSSETKLDYIIYKWDDEEEQKIEVGETSYQGIINAPKGKHNLKVKVVDINKLETNTTKDVIGDTEPTLTVKPQYVNGKVAFVIDAEDDEKIKTIEITHNGGTKETENVNDKTYHKDLTMTTGETNTLIVTVTNINGLQKTLRVKFDNK